MAELKGTFNTAQPRADDILIHAALNPPAPWERVLIAATLADSILGNHGTTGKYFADTGLLDPKMVEAKLDESLYLINTRAIWHGPEGARAAMRELGEAFTLVSRHQNGAGHSGDKLALAHIQHTARTGAAFVHAMEDAPDIDTGPAFFQTPYRANPFTALNVAAELIFHGCALAERKLGSPLTTDAAHEPFSRAGGFLESIRNSGYLGLTPATATRERLQACCAALRQTSQSTTDFMIAAYGKNVTYPPVGSVSAFMAAKYYMEAFDKEHTPRPKPETAAAPDTGTGRTLVNVNPARWGLRRPGR